MYFSLYIFDLFCYFWKALVPTKRERYTPGYTACGAFFDSDATGIKIHVIYIIDANGMLKELQVLLAYCNAA